MTNHGAGMDIGFIFDDRTSHEGNVGVNAVPIANTSIMANHSVRLYHIVITHNGIIANHGIGTDEIALAKLCALIDTCRLVNQFHKLPTTLDNTFHTRTA